MAVSLHRATFQLITYVCCCHCSVAFPQLPETLQQILSLSQKPSTLKLAGDLYKTLNEVY